VLLRNYRLRLENLHTISGSKHLIAVLPVAFFIQENR
jgi:hypothetical protein